MLRVLLCCCLLLGLALAGDYGTPQATCQPQVETFTVTRTSVLPVPEVVTQYDLQYDHQTAEVTSVIVVPSTVVHTHTSTVFPEPQVVTSSTLLTDTLYDTTFVTSFATAVATQTSQVVATEVEVEERTLTQTAVVDETVTNTVTVTNHETAFRTVTATEIQTAFLTQTETQAFVVTEVSYEVITELATATETSVSAHTVEATVTVTEHEFVTRCPTPKITYNH